MEKIIDRTAPPMVQNHIRCTVASVVGEEAGTHVRRQLADFSIAPEQSGPGVGLIDLIESVLDRTTYPSRVWCSALTFTCLSGRPPHSRFQPVLNLPYKAW